MGRERDDQEGERRVFLAQVARAGMIGGLLAGYGGFATVIARFLYPSEDGGTRRVFVSAMGDFPPGSSRLFVLPSGQRVAIARRFEQGDVDDFVALSSTCPHLGCQVHWQAENSRFFCPCHNGAFDAEGKATEGPPAAAGQSLSRFPLHVHDGLLFIELPA